jgi:phosphoribosylformylglycinamidine cyclo-ligase
MNPRTYSELGVRSAEQMPGFGSMLRSLKRTFAFPSAGRPALDFGYFANVLDVGNGQGIAISTDGVGTKLLVAQLMDKYDTVGIDCVAMNANDVVCVGARPVAMTDYIAVESPDERLLEGIAAGLARGAQQAGISIPGGELAQVPEIIRGERPGHGFDLAGTCVGLVDMDRILVGEDIHPGDCLVGLASSGIHSNGLTLARDVLLRRAGYTVQSVVPELGRRVGEELLEPTAIYVNPALEMLASRLQVKAFIHVTSDGFLNLTRVRSPVGFSIEWLPETPPIFQLISRCGAVPDEEMFRVFNMGIGFVVVVSPLHARRAINCARQAGIEAWEIGRCVAERPREVLIHPRELVGREGSFRKTS